MKRVSALIFGYNELSQEIAGSLKDEYGEIIYFVRDQEINEADIEGEIHLYDLTDDWNELDETIDIQKSIAFCVVDDEAENVFLTISLRAHFEDLLIVAIATNKESVHKLEMAGANKVIPIKETTADIITNLIEKPITNKVLHSILYEKSDLKIAQIEVENADVFGGEFPADIDWSRYQGIVVLSIMHQDLSTEFIYSSKAKRKPLQNGDILIVVGYEADIAAFEKIIGSRKYANWSDWSW